MSDTVTVVGWELYAPTTSGGKIYQIMVVDELAITIIGWGALGAQKQYQVRKYPTAAGARHYAVLQTEAKENRGYMLNLSPKQGEVDRDTAERVALSAGRDRSPATWCGVLGQAFKAGTRLTAA